MTRPKVFSASKVHILVPILCSACHKSDIKLQAANLSFAQLHLAHELYGQSKCDIDVLRSGILRKVRHRDGPLKQPGRPVLEPACSHTASTGDTPAG